MITESFEWARVPEAFKSKVLQLVARTEAITVHPEDTNYPCRKISAKELERAARTLVGKPVGRNHETKPIEGAYVLDSEYNDNRIEALAHVSDVEIAKVRAGKIQKCSIEYTWRNEKKEDNITLFEGVVINRVDLLEGVEAGDPNARVKAYESKPNTELIEGIVSIFGEKVEEGCPKCSPAKFVPRSTQPKEEHKKADFKSELPTKLPEKKEIKEDVTSTEPPKPTIDYQKVIEEQSKQIKDLTDGFVKVKEEVQSLKTNRDKDVSDARKAGVKEVVEKLEQAVPKNLFTNNPQVFKLVKSIKGVTDEFSR